MIYPPIEGFEYSYPLFYCYVENKTATVKIIHNNN